jgi:hypothetical protein
MKRRFQETGLTLYEFIDLFLVHCPGCDKGARVVLRDEPHKALEAETRGAGRGYVANLLFAPRRLVCEHCGYTRDWEGREISRYQSHDWYFGQPLWLSIACCGDTLWAFNERHLSFLADYVSADLRSRSPRRALASQLPAWVKSARNRADILKCIDRLRDTLK